MSKDVQEMLRDSVGRMFSGMVDPALIDRMEAGEWPSALWRAVEDAGFTRALVADEDNAGEGLWNNALPILHATGFHRAPLPLAETMVANALLAQAGLTPPEGPLTVAQQSRGAGHRLNLRLAGDGLVLDGSLGAVPWAGFARAIVVSGVAGDRRVIGLIDSGASGVGIIRGANVAREPRDELRFDNSACTSFAVCGDAMPHDPVDLYGALARAAMLAGAAESVLHQSVAYANDRVQFGRAIGKFQAIQQSLAVLAGEVSCARSAVAAACCCADPVPRLFDVAVAKVRAGQAAGVAAGIAHQVHGAIGFSHEHALHYGTRRLWSWRAEFGNESFWATQLGRQAITAGGGAFWRDLTALQSGPG